MKSRRTNRATLLAASFVVTASGCVTTSQDTMPPAGNPPAPTTSLPTGQPPSPTTGPTPTSPIASPNHVEKRPDGTCVEIASSHCPAGATCNPPPPKKVACPSGM